MVDHNVRQLLTLLVCACSVAACTATEARGPVPRQPPLQQSDGASPPTIETIASPGQPSQRTTDLETKLSTLLNRLKPALRVEDTASAASADQYTIGALVTDGPGRYGVVVVRLDVPRGNLVEAKCPPQLEKVCRTHRAADGRDVLLTDQSEQSAATIPRTVSAEVLLPSGHRQRMVQASDRTSAAHGLFWRGAAPLEGAPLDDEAVLELATDSSLVIE
ncbi:hypothetical protein [Lentzea terrae]|uniref:hypothetical protein n=1 Tax=Lentzea terrae TaxID=2200761 RepID=UPI001300518C|nr:hypothetical protein [Lentzea terrae]